jgi:predicted phosphodiesterase
MTTPAARPCKACGEDKPPAVTVSRGRSFTRDRCADCWRVRANELRRAGRAAARLQKPSPLPEAATGAVSATVHPAPAPTGPARTIVVASDCHVPEHDRGAWAVFLSVLREVRPDEVILAGDFGEWESVSSHGTFNENTLREDVVAVRRALNEVREAIGPDARMTYLEGNHETRLTRAIMSRAPALRGALTLTELLDLDERGVEWVPEGRQPVDRGLLRVLHGHQIYGQGGGPIYHSRKAADVYATDAGRVVTYGHTHKPQQFHRPVIGGTGRAVGLGCLRTIRPEEVRWLQGNEAGWAHGFGVFSVLAGSVHVEEVRPIRGQAMFRGRLIGGRDGAPG